MKTVFKTKYGTYFCCEFNINKINVYVATFYINIAENIGMLTSTRAVTAYQNYNFYMNCYILK